MTAVSNKCYHEQDRYKEIDATHLNGVDVVAEAGRVDQVRPSPAVIGVDVDDRAGREVDDLLFYVRRGRLRGSHSVFGQFATSARFKICIRSSTLALVKRSTLLNKNICCNRKRSSFSGFVSL